MRRALVFLSYVIALLSPLLAEPAPKGAAPAKKVSILGADPDTDTSTPPNFTQVIDTRLSNLPPNADTASIAWSLVISYDNGRSVFLQSFAGSWTQTILSGAGQGEETGPETLPPATMPALRRKGQTGRFFLTLPNGTLSSHVTSVLVSIKLPASSALVLDGKPYQWTPTPVAKPCSFVLCPTTSKGDSAIYLSGLYSPAFHSAPQYTIDAEGVFTTEVKPDSRISWGGAFNVSTDNRPSADPDSYVVSGLIDVILKRKPFWHERVEGVRLQLNLLEFEFDRQTTNKTLVSSPVFLMPFFLLPGPNKSKKNVAAWITPYWGAEIGTNLSNAIDPNGSGTVFRGLVGSSFTSTLKTNWKYLSQIGVIANYNVRIPATNEVFTNTHYISATGKTILLPVYSTQARHHLTDELDITLQKPMILTIKHEYGELPPGFRKVDNKISLGLTVMLNHTNSPDSVTGSKW